MAERIRFDLTVECPHPMSQLEARALVSELEAKLDHRAFAALESMAMAMLARTTPEVAAAWDSIRSASK